MYTIEFKPRIPVGISHLRNCTRFPSCLNCSHLSKGKILTRDAKSIHCIQCYALWSLAEILKPCVFSTRPKADHCLPLSLTHCNLQYLLDWCDSGLWLKMPAQNFLMLLVLLMLMLRKVLTSIWSRLWSWGLVDFGTEFWSRYWGWSLVRILKNVSGQGWDLDKTFRLRFGQEFEAEIWSRF